MEETRVDVPEGFDFETYINNYEGMLCTQEMDTMRCSDGPAKATPVSAEACTLLNTVKAWPLRPTEQPFKTFSKTHATQPNTHMPSSV